MGLHLNKVKSLTAGKILVLSVQRRIIQNHKDYSRGGFSEFME